MSIILEMISLMIMTQLSVRTFLGLFLQVSCRTDEACAENDTYAWRWTSNPAAAPWPQRTRLNSRRHICNPGPVMNKSLRHTVRERCGEPSRVWREGPSPIKWPPNQRRTLSPIAVVCSSWKMWRKKSILMAAKFGWGSQSGGHRFRQLSGEKIY